MRIISTFQQGERLAPVSRPTLFIYSIRLFVCVSVTERERAREESVCEGGERERERRESDEPAASLFFTFIFLL